MKAIVAMSDNPDRPLILHGVQTVFHPPQRMAAWPDPSDRRTRMVLITKGLPEIFVRDLFDAFTGKPRIDRPDRQALEDNPLAVPGLRPVESFARCGLARQGLRMNGRVCPFAHDECGNEKSLNQHQNIRGKNDRARHDKIQLRSRAKYHRYGP